MTGAIEVSLQATAMHEKYFKQFEANEYKGSRYQFILLTGQVISGVPSVTKGGGSDGTFSVALDDGKSRTVQWNRLLNATHIG